jgi:signal transduction histidine kinase
MGGVFQQRGGDISVESETQRGARFIVTLALRDAG